MDAISYLAARPIHIPKNCSPKVWYGTSLASTTPLYQDNSFAKHDYVQATYNRKVATVNKTYKNAKCKVEALRNQIHFSFICKKQLLAIYQRKKKKSDLRENAAVKIQKEIRGFLARKKHQSELVVLQQRTIQIRLQGLAKSDLRFMFSLGKAPTKAACRIQALVRRFLFRSKITKFRMYYEKLMQDRAEKIYSVIRKHILSYSSKLKLKHTIFLRQREATLLKIRKNISIHTISRIYRGLNLTFKQLKHRITKYKRRLKTLHMYGAPVNNQEQLMLSPSHSSGKFSTNFPQDPSPVELPAADDYSSNASELLRIEREEYLKKLEFMRKEKIKFGKISYCIKKKAQPLSILPFLYEKDMLENIAEPQSYSTITRATASRICESRPLRYSPPLIKARTPTPQPVFVSKRIPKKPVPLYKRETESSRMGRWDAENEIEQVVIKTYGKTRENSTVFDYTFSRRQKMRERMDFTLREEIQRPMTNFKLRAMQTSRKIVTPRPYSMAYTNINSNAF